MRTNIEKWNYFLNLIRDKERAFIIKTIGKIPETLYKVDSQGEVKLLRIEGTGNKNIICFHGKKPTRKDIAKIKDSYENKMELTPEKALLFYKTEGESGAITISRIGHTVYMSREEAEKEAKKLKEAKKKEVEMLKNGYIKCAYCGKIVPENKAIKSTIFFRSRNQAGQFVDEKRNKYCSGECANYDQMAHEG